MIELSEAQTRLDDLVSALRPGDEIILSRNHIPVAKVSSLQPRAKTGAELAKLWPKWHHLTEEEAADFERDLAESRRNLPMPKAPTWE
jgi:antitoxin (DNA-binding transcriptional repressor) of toxin-antitoxin stability system